MGEGEAASELGVLEDPLRPEDTSELEVLEEAWGRDDVNADGTAEGWGTRARVSVDWSSVCAELLA